MTNSERLAEIRKKREEERKNSSSQSVGRSYSNSDFFKKKRFEQDVKLDTFNDDLTSVTTQVNSALNGWQTEETMRNTKAVATQMHSRIGQYRDYVKQYGGATDTTEIDAMTAINLYLIHGMTEQNSTDSIPMLPLMIQL